MTDKIWARLKPVVVEARGKMGRPPKQSYREFLEAVLNMARTGHSWRDLPEEFGFWLNNYMRFRRWEAAGFWARLFALLQTKENEDLLKLFVDSTIIPVHPHAAGAPKKRASHRLWDALGADRQQRYTRRAAANAAQRF